VSESVRSTGPELLTNAEKQVSTLVRRALSACVVVSVCVVSLSIVVVLSDVGVCVVVVLFIVFAKSVVVLSRFFINTIISVCSPNLLSALGSSLAFLF